MKKIKNCWLTLLLLAIAVQPVFVSASIPQAVGYLESQADDPWITMALIASGQTAVASGHLRQVSGTSATDYAKTILAVSALNQDPATFGNIDYIAQLKSKYDGTQMGDSNLLNDDAWSILALASVGQVESAQAQAAKDFLLANQNADGGWSYSVGAGSDTNDTAAVVMALVEAGASADSRVIGNALAYLRSAQNDDGGFGYQPGNDSDSGSDAWIISALIKLDIDPATWIKNSNNPVTHLESLQADDGGFWWVDPSGAEWNNKAMTAYAVIALSGFSYPIGYYQAADDPDPIEGQYHLRIEGSTSTICDIYVSATTALDLIEQAASECGYSYNITQESFGPYLRSISDDTAQGLDGWLYFVNNVSPPVGAADYELQSGDEVLWYFGQWGWLPTRITASQTEINPGDTIGLSAEYFDGNNWQPLSQAVIKINNEERIAQSNGQLNVNIYENGVYQVYVDMNGYVRSPKKTINVGDTVNNNVGLQVEIDQTSGSGQGNIGGEAIALVVGSSQVSFGSLGPGESGSQAVNLSNEGTVQLAIGASVSGDVVFTQGITIDDQFYDDYSSSLAPYEDHDAQVTLTIPQDYLASGIKNGELIFWATAQ
ncbi:MAG: DUF4430 domain-containing protein [Patescibacteria group bacterium]|jgi:hypothetical protein|nr:DUF4430 domain-containing protein [Patescibacteria group bacterium]